MTILCVGRLKEDFWRQACAEYQKRMTPFAKVSVIEVAECRLPKDPSPAEIQAGLRAEGELLLAKMPQNAAVVSLCVEGEKLSSERFSAWICDRTLRGVSHIAFVIGGSTGLWEQVKARSDLRLSFSGMTFPHMLARVMLCEQLYRAFQIMSDSRYHK